MSDWKHAAALVFGCAIACPALARASTFADLYDFGGGVGGSYPSAALTPFAGALFGTTTGGNGPDNPASIYKVDPDTGAVTNTVFPYGYNFFGSLTRLVTSSMALLRPGRPVVTA